MTTRFSIAGSGAYVPRRIVASSAIDARFGLATGTVETRFGIARRAVAGLDETSSVMGAAAANEAITDAGWAPDTLDVIIGAASVMEQPIPGTATLIQRQLGLGGSGIPAFDVNATCLSGLVGLDIALMGIAAGRWRRVLVVTADIASAAIDPDDLETAAIFGDGAAAIAIEAGGAHTLLAHRLDTYGDHADLCRLEAGGTRLRPEPDLDAFLGGRHFRMAGRRLVAVTARLFPSFMDRLLAEAGTTRDGIDIALPHQASRAALDHLQHVLGGRGERIVDIFADHGNQVATSLLHALHRARTDGRLTAGQTVLMVGSSAGISLGGTVVRW